MSIAFNRICVCRMKLVGLVLGMVATTSMAMAQDPLSPQDDEPSLSELMDDELSLRDLMLEDFEKEASEKEDDQGGAQQQRNSQETEPSEPEEDSETDDESEETSEAEENNDERTDEPATPETTKSTAWDRLNRPLTEIPLKRSLSVLGGAAEKTEAPTNVAADLINTDVSIWITSSDSAIPIYERRTTPFNHRPLYFEDPNLERCGNALGCLQNPVSAIRFMGEALLLPCQIARLHPDCPVAATEDCRCGEAFSCD